MTKKLSITLTDEDGVVFAIHKLTPKAALAVLTQISNDRGTAAMLLSQLHPTEIERALDDATEFMSDLRTACDNIIAG